MFKQLILLGCLVAALQPSVAYVARERTNCNSSSVHNSFILIGASGDLAKREVYPALWSLFRDDQLPENTKIFGHARSKRTIDDIRKNVEPYVQIKPDEEKRYDDFWSTNEYISGVGSEADNYEKIAKTLEEFEDGGKGNRLYYLALPPESFPNASSQIRRVGMAKNGWTRIVLEKPFGRDSESAEELSNHLDQLFTEDQIYRMDHFLNYEMVQNIVTLRFANRIFSPAWDRENIAAIEIDLKENLGVEGRGSFFDPNGIIRDVMQNHLLQMMSLVAMERPKSNGDDDIRDAKVNLLKATRAIAMEDVVLGQYVADPNSEDPRERIGYREDPTVPDDSISSTFALTVLKVDNERWRDVPFIIRAGKGVNINQTEIVIQFKDVEAGLFDKKPKRNELHLIAKGTEGVQAKITSKYPGYTNETEEIALDFKYEEAHKDLRILQPYEKSILDVFRGLQLHFVRNDEVKEAWRIFTPILHELEGKKIQPIEYKFGSTGPTEADEMEQRYNFLRQ